MAEETLEGHHEVAEREILVAGRARSLGAGIRLRRTRSNAIAAPVQGARESPFPRKLWVVIGSLHGMEFPYPARPVHRMDRGRGPAVARRIGMALLATSPPGSPRSQASSVDGSAKTWQLEHARLAVGRRGSERVVEEAPAVDRPTGGSGLWSVWVFPLSRPVSRGRSQAIGVVETGEHVQEAPRSRRAPDRSGPPPVSSM